MQTKSQIKGETKVGALARAGQFLYIIFASLSLSFDGPIACDLDATLRQTSFKTEEKFAR